MSRAPLVTVLMSVHNDLRFLPAAVESILAQAFEDFEFLIVDDGSNDGCSEYLHALRDERVHVLTNSANIGLTRSLNRGLDVAGGKYIARMDADDISEPERIALQVSFLEEHSHVGLLGTGRLLIDEAGEIIASAAATSGRFEVRRKMLLGNAFAHPTVMMRRDVLECRRLRYDETFQTAQDYELWVRLLARTAGDNLPDPLVRYRIRDGISRTRKSDQLANHDRIAYAAIRQFAPGFAIPLEDVRQLRGRFGGFSVRELEMDPSDEKWQKIYAQLCSACDAVTA
jgi:glycosyltransferase involved in cell wall biosynthesis